MENGKGSVRRPARQKLLYENRYEQMAWGPLAGVGQSETGTEPAVAEMQQLDGRADGNHNNDGGDA